VEKQLVTDLLKENTDVLDMEEHVPGAAAKAGFIFFFLVNRVYVANMLVVQSVSRHVLT